MQNRFLLHATLFAFLFSSALCAQPQCGDRSAVGTWALNATGWSIPAGGTTAVPVTFIGVLTVDYSARITGPLTLIWAAGIPGTSIPAGAVLDFDLVNGTIQLTSDCTGILRYSVQLKGMPAPPIGPYVERVVLLPDKGEMLSMAISTPISVPLWTHVMKRMSPVPVAAAWPKL
jgi:hypothetical protein